MRWQLFHPTCGKRRRFVGSSQTPCLGLPRPSSPSTLSEDRQTAPTAPQRQEPESRRSRITRPVAWRLQNGRRRPLLNEKAHRLSQTTKENDDQGNPPDKYPHSSTGAIRRLRGTFRGGIWTQRAKLPSQRVSRHHEGAMKREGTKVPRLTTSARKLHLQTTHRIKLALGPENEALPSWSLRAKALDGSDCKGRGSGKLKTQTTSPCLTRLLP